MFPIIIMSLPTSLTNDELAMSVIIFSSIIYVLSLSNIKLPCSVKNLFDNIIFKMVFLSLIIVYTFEKSPHVALIIALVFVMTLEYLNKEKMYENCEYLKSYIEQKENVSMENVMIVKDENVNDEREPQQ
jgi:hypothetical protein